MTMIRLKRDTEFFRIRGSRGDPGEAPRLIPAGTEVWYRRTALNDRVTVIHTVSLMIDGVEYEANQRGTGERRNA